MREGLRRGAQDALALARRQEALTRPPRGGCKSREPRRCGARDHAGAAESLGPAPRGHGPRSPSSRTCLNRRRRPRNRRSARAVGQLRRGSGTPAELGEAQGALNRLALVALSGLGMGGQESQGASAEEQMAQEMSSIGGPAVEPERGDRPPLRISRVRAVSRRRCSSSTSSPASRGWLPGSRSSRGDRGPAAPGARSMRWPGKATESPTSCVKGGSTPRPGSARGSSSSVCFPAGRTLERERPTDEREATSAERGAEAGDHSDPRGTSRPPGSPAPLGRRAEWPHARRAAPRARVFRAGEPPAWGPEALREPLAAADGAAGEWPGVRPPSSRRPLSWVARDRRGPSFRPLSSPTRRRKDPLRVSPTWGGVGRGGRRARAGQGRDHGGDRARERAADGTLWAALLTVVEQVDGPAAAEAILAVGIAAAEAEGLAASARIMETLPAAGG